MIRRRLAGWVHGLTDEVVTGVLSGPKLYPDGFGDLAQLESIVQRVRSYDAAAPPFHLEMRWDGPPFVDVIDRAVVRRGRFRSPAAELMPHESQWAPIELRLPADTRTHERPPVCVLFAATGEAGLTWRRRTSIPLLRRGIGVLLLENPYYGARRPAGQTMAILRTVRDQFAMNTATVEEGRALLQWLRGQGYTRIGVSGYSQGGMMAAFSAALTDFPVAVVPRASGRSAIPVFTENALGRRFAWDRLAEPFGGNPERAREFFAQCLGPVDVGRFRPPVDTRLAVVVGSRHDRFIRPAEVESLHEHWPGAGLRWVDAGHLTGVIVGARAQLRAVIDAFSRFESDSR